MLKYQLQSGAKVEFNLGTIEQALGLYRALIYECKNSGLDVTVLEGDTVLDVVMKNKEAILNILGSEHVIECIKECCSKVLYNGQKFSMNLFEEEKARQDWERIMQNMQNGVNFPGNPWNGPDDDDSDDDQDDDDSLN